MKTETKKKIKKVFLFLMFPILWWTSPQFYILNEDEDEKGEDTREEPRKS